MIVWSISMFIGVFDRDNRLTLARPIDAVCRFCIINFIIEGVVYRQQL